MMKKKKKKTKEMIMIIIMMCNTRKIRSLSLVLRVVKTVVRALEKMRVIYIVGIHQLRSIRVALN